MKKFTRLLFPFGIFSLLFCCRTFGQQSYKAIPLPDSLRSLNFEYSGMSWNFNRLYLLPQYGNHKETKLKGQFNLYSILADSIGRVIDGTDSVLTAYRTVRVNNLDKLPDSIEQQYEGFEAITFNKDEVFLAIETSSDYDYCYILKGKLNAQRTSIDVDPLNFISLKRYPYVENAGFESLLYLPRKNKLVAIYEYNAMKCGGIGYLIDPFFKKPVRQLNIPFQTFRITDIQTGSGKDVFALNFYYNGDYKTYLDNNMLRNAEKIIKKASREIKDNLDKNPAYLKEKTTNYAQLIRMSGLKSKKWTQVVSFPAAKNNWEGMVLYKQGALVISDANRSSKQLTTFAFISF